MPAPVFLDVAAVLHIHDAILAKDGGRAGILNRSMLESAVASPYAGFGDQYLNTFPYGMAAALLVGLARNHAFADGNKRTALAATSTFLTLNSCPPRLSNDDIEALVLDAATNVINKHRVADALQNNRYP